MPTSTFYNLPQEKKARLLEAARKEFTRVPFNEASINQIIQEVGISRGSFYTYFTDKVDLVFCVLEDFFNHLFIEATRVLQETNGNAFSLFIMVYDFVREYSQYHGLMQMFNNVLLGLNSDERSTLKKMTELEANNNIVPRILQLLNFNGMKIDSREDIEDILIMLFAVTKTSCLEQLSSNGEEEERRRFLKRLDMLKYGVMQRPINHTDEER